MFAPGFAYEVSSRPSLSSRWARATHAAPDVQVFPSTYRPFFAPLPTTGLFDPLETVDYFKAIREKLLTEPTVSAAATFSNPVGFDPDHNRAVEDLGRHLH